MKVSFDSKGDFSKTIKYLGRSANGVTFGDLDKFGRQGVDALSKNTPIDSGSTANSWRYEITKTKGKVVISWLNSNVVNGLPIAIILQYGHGTGNGGWVEGRDYINPTLRPIFDKMTNEAWKEVTK